MSRRSSPAFAVGVATPPPAPPRKKAEFRPPTGVGAFIDAIRRADPDGKGVMVAYHPNGDWSVYIKTAVAPEGEPNVRHPTGWPRPATANNLAPKWVGEFITFQDWVNFATTRLSGAHGRYGQDVASVCVDRFGRRCTCGGDFARARDEDAFPVRFFWECAPTVLEDGEGHEARAQGHREGFAAAVQWLRDLDAKEKPATQGHSAAWLADQMEASS